MRRWAGDLAGRADPGGRAPPWARGDVRRGEPGPDRATERLRRTLAALPLPRAIDGRIVLGVDVSPWLRPDAATSPQSVCWNADDTALAATVGGYTGVDSDELGRLG